ncbi:energy-coupling factor transporter transmembrane component T family protein [Bordetella avium]|uniref:energy-coupling factor transporter transmembrane component T family protein n=1 Tax=Bordetella avium TaxID=521 RepID=UPI000E681715|nr:energy-coupling factor transporter transmembrane protein EcfT [Bordetella avium]AZY48575.1 cobalt ABC transporter [Bordetella avium]RIQ17043.1 energy-coupling factor transporter transmembrane protein EcfT [Bordetella avium]RIQ36230.1 energy-coupling factor transporter transmembrane protein EcfT [Bordetella avium]
MMEALYVPGHSLLHRLPAGVKLLGLAAAGVLLFTVRDLRLLGLACLVGGALIACCRPRPQRLWRQLRGLFWIVLALALFTWWAQDGQQALVVLARTAALICFATALSLSTPVSALLATIELALSPWSRWVNPARVSLALALCLRFIPEIWRNYQEIREAQSARGLARHPLALLVPLIVRTLKRADEVAQAIDARS